MQSDVDAVLRLQLAFVPPTPPSLSIMVRTHHKAADELWRLLLPSYLLFWPGASIPVFPNRLNRGMRHERPKKSVLFSPALVTFMCIR